MSELTDFLAEVEAEKEAVAQFAAKLAGTGQIVETAKAKAAELGSNDVVARLARVEAELEQMETGRAVLEGSLEKARIQVDAAIYGNPIGSPVGGPKPSVEGLDAVPPHVRHGQNPTGDELMGNDPSIGAFQKEHENANADRKMNRMSRLGRAGVRNAGDLRSFANDLTTSATGTTAGIDPPASGSYQAITEVPSNVPQLHSPPAAKVGPTDLVGTVVMMAAVTVEGIGRVVEHRRRRRHGE